MFTMQEPCVVRIVRFRNAVRFIVRLSLFQQQTDRIAPCPPFVAA